MLYLPYSTLFDGSIKFSAAEDILIHFAHCIGTTHGEGFSNKLITLWKESVYIQRKCSATEGLADKSSWDKPGTYRIVTPKDKALPSILHCFTEWSPKTKNKKPQFPDIKLPEPFQQETEHTQLLWLSYCLDMINLYLTRKTNVKRIFIPIMEMNRKEQKIKIDFFNELQRLHPSLAIIYLE